MSVARQDMLDFIYLHAPDGQKAVLSNGERAVVVPGPSFGDSRTVRAKLLSPEQCGLSWVDDAKQR